MPRGDFVMVPRDLLYSGVSADAAKLWATLEDCARDAPAAIATQGQLAAVMRCSPRQVRRLQAELVDTGWLEVLGRDGGRGLGSIYRPLHRRRTTVETWTEPSTFPRLEVGAGGQVRRVLHSSSRARKREEPTEPLFDVDEPSSSAPRPRGCGLCDETQHIPWVDEAGVERGVRRCPACHPLAARF